MNEWISEDFWEVKSSYDANGEFMSLYTRPNPHRMYNTRSEPRCEPWNLGDNDSSL